MRNPGLALIFDMDGVIIDSNAIHEQAWAAYLRTHGIEPINVRSGMVGRHNVAIVQDFFAGRDLSSRIVAEHGASKEALYREMIGPVLLDKLLPGIREFLQRYSAWPKAVASNAEPANVDFVLEQSMIAGYFRAVVNGHDVVRPKPHPDVYLRAAELLNVSPANCVVFEDSLTGVRAGRAAGMRVVGVGDSADRLPGAELRIIDFRAPELDVWLGGLVPRA